MNPDAAREGEQLFGVGTGAGGVIPPDQGEVETGPIALRKAFVPKFQAIFSECYGTAVLVAVGCGSAIVQSTRIGVAITFGFTIMALVQSFVAISGGHFNPVVTLCMCLSRRMSPLLGLFYVIAQCVGAIIGAAILKAIMPDGKNYGATVLGPGVSTGRGFFIEAWMTCVLIFIVYSTAVSSRAYKKLAPLPIAFTISALIYFGGDLTGGSLNPARSFGPAVVSGIWTDHWVYWIGPLVGGFIGWLLYQVSHFQPV
eukprot:TRINITY_DN5179_c1_g1_i1.p1 TRINITY_DN5179_c1_g1~~TRINITY_DN5179_c1_g1_i1.p1  ORF type:complete len:256 (-),score=80.95 TRINITY_DN5179_c1_g1_i1:160-927(-)